MVLNYLIILMGIGIGAGMAVVFVLLIKRKKPEGALKKYLILAGASLAGFLIFVVLHNVISALLSQYLNREIEEPVFFILATIVCPAGLLVGVIGSIAQLIKGRGRS